MSISNDRPAGDSTPPAVWFAHSPDRKGIYPQSHLAQFKGKRDASTVICLSAACSHRKVAARFFTKASAGSPRLPGRPHHIVNSRVSAAYGATAPLPAISFSALMTNRTASDDCFRVVK
ncbi:hypothetical protein GCN74_11080 [Janthinobacterium sp. FT14W]|nr:hypothetical protein GCN74_11080 [Janthinobacterium sp. FT14W]